MYKAIQPLEKKSLKKVWILKKGLYLWTIKQTEMKYTDQQLSELTGWKAVEVKVTLQDRIDEIRRELDSGSLPLNSVGRITLRKELDELKTMKSKIFVF